jgi:hypothetical protein
MLDTIALALALGVLSAVTIPLGRITAPRGMGRDRHQRLAFWLVTFPLYVATVAALALSAWQGGHYLLAG